MGHIHFDNPTLCQFVSDKLKPKFDSSIFFIIGEALGADLLVISIILLLNQSLNYMP